MAAFGMTALRTTNPMTIGMRLSEAALPVNLPGFHKPNTSPCRVLAERNRRISARPFPIDVRKTRKRGSLFDN